MILRCGWFQVWVRLVLRWEWCFGRVSVGFMSEIVQCLAQIVISSEMVLRCVSVGFTSGMVKGRVQIGFSSGMV